MLTKRINDILDFDFDFTLWLADRGNDTISTFEVTTTLTKGAVTHSNGVVKVFLSGGSRGSTAPVVCKVVTAGGRTKEVATSITIVN